MRERRFSKVLDELSGRFGVLAVNTGMSAAFVQILIDALDGEVLDTLAERLAPRLAKSVSPDGWLTVAEAAEHLRCPKSRVYSLVSARRIPFVKDGSRTLFRRSELDAWLREGGGKRP
jgi:excisionase family DNA binding protein